MTQVQLNARQHHIIDRMMLNGDIKLAELKETYDVTEMTLRRDLEKLEQLGMIRRTFGGAILIGKEVALQERTGVRLEEKMRIGRKAADLVKPGDSLFIDGGSTTLQVAKFLQPNLNLTVVTNGLNIAAELQSKHITTIVVGGNLVERTSTLVGPIAVTALSKMAFDHVFLGCTGLTSAHGFSNSNIYEAEIKQLVQTLTNEVSVVMDHTKFGMKDLFSFARMDEVNRIVTDRIPEDQELLTTLKDAAVNICTSYEK